MRNDIHTIARLRPIEFDSIPGGVPMPDRYDVHSPCETLHDDLAEVPQAYAAYLDHLKNQWS